MNTTRAARAWVVVLTLLVGGVMLAATLQLDPGDDRFLPAGFALAAVWVVGAWLAGSRLRWPVEPGSLRLGAFVGAALLAASLLTALVVAHVPPLRRPAEALLHHADGGTLLPVLVLTVVNGVAEEMLFRGALYDVLPGALAVPVSTAVYTATTVGSGVALLVLAAAVIGAATALLRRRTDGLWAPIATHLVWSVGMLLLLPATLATGR